MNLQKIRSPQRGVAISLSEKAALATALIGFIVLVGWVFHIEWFTSLFPGLPPMRINTALAIILNAASLWFWHKFNAQTDNFSGWKRSLSATLAIIVASIALLTLIQFRFNINLGIDRLLINGLAPQLEDKFLMRMPLSAALKIFLLSVALILLNCRLYTLSQGLAFGSFLIALFGLSGYIYQVEYFYSLFSGGSAALTAIIAFCILSLGILFARHEQGWLKVITSPYSGGITARRLLPLVIALPLLLGGSIIFTQRNNLIPIEVSIIFRSTINILILGGVTWWNARFLNKLDLKQRQTEQELRLSHEQLENRVAERTAELTNANHRLEESYQLLQSVIEGISDSVFVKDRYGKYVIVNSAMSEKLGKPIAEIVGFNDYDLFAPEIAQKFRETDDRIMELGEAQEIEEELLKNNQNKAYLSTKSPWRDRDGNVIGLIGVIKDITHRKQTEISLKYREWLARFFLEHTPIPAAVFDTEMRYLIVSERWLKDYRLEDQNIIGISYYEVFPETPQRWKEIHQRCLAGAVEISEEDQFIRADGTIDWLKWEVRPWYDETGAIGGIIMFTEVITDRKQAEIALKQSEQNYANLASVIPVGLYRSDTQGYINYVNQRWCELSGLSAEQAMGQGWEKAVHPEDRTCITQAWQEATHNQSTFSTEYRYQRPDGSISWLYGQAIAERSANGEIIGYIGTVTDITERKRIEQDLQEAKQRVVHILESMSDAFVALDRNWQITYVNQMTAEINQVSPEELIGKNHWEVWSGSIGTICEEKYRQAMADLTPVHFEYLYEARKRWYEIHAYPSREGLGVYYRDIDDRKRAEESLRENETRLRLALQATKSGIWDWDFVTNSATVSEEYCLLLGWKPEIRVITYQEWLNWIHPDDRASVITAIEQAIEQYQDYQFEYRILHPEGIRWIASKGQVFYDFAGNPVRMLGNIQDITERKQAEIDLQEKEARFRIAAESSSDLIYEWDTVIGTMRWFGDIDTQLGYEPGEIPRTLEGWETRIHPDDRAFVNSQIEECLQTGVAFAGEYRIADRNGEYRIWLDRGRAIFDAEGRPGKWYGAIADITASKRAEAALQASEEQLRLTLEFSQIGSWAWDMIANRLNWNNKLFQLLGLDPQTAEANYETWRDRIYPEDLERVEAAIYYAIENHTDYEAEHRVISPDRSVHWIVAKGRAIYDRSGQPLRMLGVVFDITDRKQAEINLQESEERFRKATIDAPLPIILHADDGVILQVNHAWTEISGYSPEEIPTIADWTEKAYGSRKEVIKATIEQLHHLNCRVYEGEYTIRTCSGESRIWDFYSAPLGKLPDGRNLVISTAIDITERKRAEADLQQYKDIFQFSEHGLAVSKGTVIEMVNPAFARTHGYSIAEMIGKPILSLFPAELWTEAISFMQQLNEVGHLTHESYHLRKDGTPFPVFLDITIVKDPQGNPLYRIVSTVDISDRKQAEVALLESEERLRLALQAANQGLWDLNVQTGEAIVSPEYARMLGYEPEELRETNAKWRERLHSEEQETVYQVYTDYIVGKRDDYRVECRQLTKTGDWKWILSIGKVVEWDKSGKPVRMLGTHTDISDRKQAEADLLASEKQLRSILENMPVMLDAFDNEGNIIVWNQECERVTGYSGEEMMQNPQAWEMVYPDRIYREKMMNKWAQIGNDYRNWEWDLVSKTGEIKTIAWSNISAHFPIPGWASWGVGIDITERKKAELEVIQLNQSLEQRVHERTAELAAANKELEAFSYSVSHDLRAPLRGIDGFSKVLLQRYAEQLDEQGKHYLDRIRAGTQRMGELIEDMLMLSRVTRAEMKRIPVNLSSIAQEITVHLSESQSQRSVQWIITPEIIALGDAALLRIVLENLLSNAWKFTSNCTQTQIEFGITILPDNTSAYFVKDNGVGFDMAYVNKLFIAFQRLHSTNEFPGTGVGLAIVQRIIHRHGGNVWAEGIINQGATFYFTLCEVKERSNDELLLISVQGTK